MSYAFWNGCGRRTMRARMLAPGGARERVAPPIPKNFSQAAEFYDGLLATLVFRWQSEVFRH
jgi:hypothetical protein